MKTDAAQSLRRALPFHTDPGGFLPALRMLAAGHATDRHEGEVLSCAYSDDAGFVLTSGWDGRLRCWDSQTGTPLSVIETGNSAVPACAISNASRYWLAGSLDGLLAVWDPITHRKIGQVLPHTRPITAVAVAPGGEAVATASFDRKVVLYRNPERLAFNRVLLGHRDTVLGCGFSPDGSTLLSWSTDTTVRLWDAGTGADLAELDGADVITCASASPNGLWVVAGTEGGSVQLWDLEQLKIVQSRMLREPLAGCYFLLGQEMILTIDTGGRMTLFSMPHMEQLFEQVTLFVVRSCACSPFGDQVMLGCNNGRPQFALVEGTDLAAKVRPRIEERSVLWRLLGRGAKYTLHCPICTASFSLPRDPTGTTLNCPGCGQALMVAQDSQVVPTTPGPSSV